MLRVKDLVVHYDSLQVLWGVSLNVFERDFVCILGPNGAGKSTLVNSVSGLVKNTSGEIWFMGQRIDSMQIHERIRLGIAHVLERRRVFPHMTVRENLEMGAYIVPQTFLEALEMVYDLFPRLAERSEQQAITLSGGEQQMLAIARGLMTGPKLLILDEPFLGLSPELTEIVANTLERINSNGIAVLFIEQNVEVALSIAKEGYILEAGRIAIEGPTENIIHDPKVREIYLGIA